ncbi:MAG: SusD/RagB family nutrient-binding outer membrane lipoprotein [Sphingobacteriales bacterium]|nr:MAG: SusD/RagB family nutrient-binding outer membrane lipoprotein [Sphingobacteriales bacterium]
MFSHVNATLTQAVFPGDLMDYSEVEFMIAEAIERGYAAGGTAQEHYNNAVTGSIIYWGGTASEATALKRSIMLGSSFSLTSTRAGMFSVLTRLPAVSVMLNAVTSDGLLATRPLFAGVFILNNAELMFCPSLSNTRLARFEDSELLLKG